MKPNAPKSLTLLLLVILVACAACVARSGRRHQRDARPGRPEIRAYFQANVLPVLQQQRQKLEPQLTAEDRAQLATYRTQLKALKEQGQTLRQSFRLEEGTGSAPGTRPALTEIQQQQVHQLRFQAGGIMLSVAQMARKYDGSITQLAQEVQPQKEKWATDIRALIAKNTTPEQQRTATAGERMRGHGPGNLRRFFKPAMFLLMDPNAPVANAERGVGNTGFYPNPVAATSQLDYEVKKAGPVSVDLLDKDGKQLRPLVSDAKSEKGPHTQQLDLHDLPAGTYFYKITTKSGTETKRFVKE